MHSALMTNNCGFAGRCRGLLEGQVEDSADLLFVTWGRCLLRSGEGHHPDMALLVHLNAFTGRCCSRAAMIVDKQAGLLKVMVGQDHRGRIRMVETGGVDNEVERFASNRAQRESQMRLLCLQGRPIYDAFEFDKFFLKYTNMVLVRSDRHFSLRIRVRAQLPVVLTSDIGIRGQGNRRSKQRHLVMFAVVYCRKIVNLFLVLGEKIVVRIDVF